MTLRNRLIVAGLEIVAAMAVIVAVLLGSGTQKVIGQVVSFGYQIKPFEDRQEGTSNTATTTHKYLTTSTATSTDVFDVRKANMVRVLGITAASTTGTEFAYTVEASDSTDACTNTNRDWYTLYRLPDTAYGKTILVPDTGGYYKYVPGAVASTTKPLWEGDPIAPCIRVNVDVNTANGSYHLKVLSRDVF